MCYIYSFIFIIYNTYMHYICINIILYNIYILFTEIKGKRLNYCTVDKEN